MALPYLSSFSTCRLGNRVSDFCNDNQDKVDSLLALVAYGRIDLDEVLGKK